MYSRYIPNGAGGFVQQRIPDPPPAAPDSPPPAPPPIPPPGEPPHSATADAARLHGTRPHSSQPGRPRPPLPPTMPIAPEPAGPFRLLGGLLPRSMDLEDWLVLAVLVLAMMDDGAESSEILIACALYLLLGGFEDPGT